MPDLTRFAFDDDEIAILIDALEADIEDYADAAREAQDAGDPAQAGAFKSAADRVRSVLHKVRGASND